MKCGHEEWNEERKIDVTCGEVTSIAMKLTDENLNGKYYAVLRLNREVDEI